MTRDITIIKKLLNCEIKKTRFLGIGNPSESGIHLLYYFRQENGLSPNNFLDVAQILKRKNNKDNIYEKELAYPDIKRYIFIDDFCGNGNTAIDYSENVLKEIKSLAANVQFYYFALFGTKDGMERVKNESVFDKNCVAVFELDSTYKVLSDNSRFFASCPLHIKKNTVTKLIEQYGKKLWAKYPCGYENNQMLLGFYHNIPNNTIPIIWSEDRKSKWVPIFKRYPKSTRG